MSHRLCSIYVLHSSQQLRKRGEKLRFAREHTMFSIECLTSEAPKIEMTLAVWCCLALDMQQLKTAVLLLLPLPKKAETDGGFDIEITASLFTSPPKPASQGSTA
jgi:hypothetical protein